MTHPREEMACQTCLSPLNILDGTYLHPLHHPGGHPPVPVPARHLDTINRTCDFCGDDHPMWTLRGGAVAVLATGDRTDLLQHLGETWAACVPCATDIDAWRPHRLVDRAARRISSYDIPFARTQISRLHQAFLDQRQPGRTLITTTAWPDLTINPRDLPKIRDRLAGFYRGPDQLPDTLPTTGLRHELAASLDQARLYWIDPTFTDLADHAATHLPAVTTSNDLTPADDGLLVWARSTTPRRITAASWTTHNDTIQVAIYRAIGAGLDDTALQRLRDEVGWLAPMRTYQLHHQQLVDDAQGHGYGILLATWLLIAQRAAQTVRAEVEKTVRRRYARANRPLPDVRIVSIRGTTPREATDRTATTGGGPTYTNRIWVTGHWRNQAHGPGRTLRRPVYIHPFLRGPKDAPIKLNTTVRILRDHTTGSPKTGPDA